MLIWKLDTSYFDHGGKIKMKIYDYLPFILQSVYLPAKLT